ncbi:hypothetical protein LPN01_13935 [Sphingomonas sp. A2-49]|uniref:hypothetical protein n=1 Tax=Sphingomonas sp. A2-49 TaxID=1391375 RepID=UPI0021CF8339|nr:hypothetical protein [Sphingomonas sp. A2-49]MCU6455181.1 hypothetical protein [Sphingomonas sp. A2-49]
MTAAPPSLLSFVADELEAAVDTSVATAARAVVRRIGGVAVLFYGSVLRTGDLDGVLDFYVLTPRPRGWGLRAWATRTLWPDVSFHEVVVGARTIRAKVAAMPLDTFCRAAEGRTLDTTVWTRFAQPAALVWAADPSIRVRVVRAVAYAGASAARFAAVLGPDRGRPADFWLALFRQTYSAELRVEAPGRERQIIGFAPARFDALLPLAWQGAGIGHERRGGELAPMLGERDRRAMLSAWLLRQRLGKWLNVARLVKAAFTFDGAARYGLWKLERHTGVALPLTPWRERHPVLAAPGVMWRVWQTRAS